jgi:hypothetical protein
MGSSCIQNPEEEKGSAALERFIRAESAWRARPSRDGRIVTRTASSKAFRGDVG